MPPLDNPRHERFAQALAEGKTADEALTEIGHSLIGQPEPKRFYVYILIDPRDMSIFYVGKGKGKRMHQHYRSWVRDKGVNERKGLRIAEIHSAKMKPVAVWVADDMDERDAYRAERHLMFRIEGLTNINGPGMTELDRAALMAKQELKLIRPYCRMFRLIPPVHTEPGWEHDYWGCIASFVEIIKMADGEKLRIPASDHFDAWRDECVAAGRLKAA